VGVHAQYDEPALARDGLDPVLFPTFRRFRGKVNVDGAVLVLLWLSDIAVDARELLIGLQHGARLIVVQSKEPSAFAGI